MKKRYSKKQIIKAIKQHEAGTKADDICRELGISNGTFCNWRSSYAGPEANDATRAGEREHQAEETAGRQVTRSLSHEGRIVKKVVKPARKKPITARLVEHFQLSERPACHLVGPSGFPYRLPTPPLDIHDPGQHTVQHTRVLVCGMAGKEQPDALGHQTHRTRTYQPGAIVGIPIEKSIHGTGRCISTLCHAHG